MGPEAIMALSGIEPAPRSAPAPLEALAARLRTGDPAAFADLVGTTQARLLGLAWRLLGDRDLARDAAQETYLRVHRFLHTHRPEAPFEPWLIRIAVNACHDLGRRRGPRPAELEDLDALPSASGPSDDADEALLRTQRRALILRAVASLPTAERTALVLRDLEGFSTEDVARVLGVRPVTIRTQAASARAKVQAACARFIADPRGGRP